MCFTKVIFEFENYLNMIRIKNSLHQTKLNSITSLNNTNGLITTKSTPTEMHLFIEKANLETSIRQDMSLSAQQDAMKNDSKSTKNDTKWNNLSVTVNSEKMNDMNVKENSKTFFSTSETRNTMVKINDSKSATKKNATKKPCVPDATCSIIALPVIKELKQGLIKPSSDQRTIYLNINGRFGNMLFQFATLLALKKVTCANVVLASYDFDLHDIFERIPFTFVSPAKLWRSV